MKLVHNKLMTLPLPIGAFVLSLSLVSCGKGFKKDPNEDLRQEEQAEQKYNVQFRPLNSKKVGKYLGWSEISLLENQFWVRIKVEGPNIADGHAQYLHTGGKCPTMTDDTNHDGYLDFMETLEVVGEVLLPLDGNLNSQFKGLNDFPKMRKNSNMYYYSESCNYSWMLDDLKKEDLFPTDMITKLQEREGLKLMRRVILIYGVSLDRRLPETVRSFDGYPSQATLPIACGEVRQGASSESGR